MTATVIVTVGAIVVRTGNSAMVVPVEGVTVPDVHAGKMTLQTRKAPSMPAPVGVVEGTAAETGRPGRTVPDAVRVAAGVAGALAVTGPPAGRVASSMDPIGIAGTPTPSAPHVAADCTRGTGACPLAPVPLRMGTW